MTEPSSTKPYLMRALYEWCVDNGYTPYVSVVVDANTRVPVEYVRNGEIVLNIGPLAANKLKIGSDYVEFSARFGGAARELIIPVSQISAIYARENGQGMSFPIEHDTDTPADESATSSDQSATPSTGPKPAVVHTQERSAQEDSETPAPPASGGKPTLRVVK